MQTNQLNIIKELNKLNSEHRLEVFKIYCTECGDKNPNCQCWNDE